MTTEKVSVHARPFVKMGARVKFQTLTPVPGRDRSTALSLNVRRDKEGEYFLVELGNRVKLQVLDVQPKDRHLLLLTKTPDDLKPFRPDIKARYLLGHDERHWFVAAVPESNPATTVNAAKQALKPKVVQDREHGVKPKHRHARANDARIRQGEWFFVPAGSVQINKLLILKNEPIRRGSGKAHMCEELYRTGGESVHVNRAHPNGITPTEFNKLSLEERNDPSWRMMTRNAQVLVRGKIRHSDHATVILDGWHEVHVNNESRALAMANVAFLD